MEINDNKSRNFGDESNVVQLHSRKKLDSTHPPFINLPYATKYLALLLIAIHVVLWTGSEIFHVIDTDFVFNRFGFIPARLTEGRLFGIWSIISLLAFTFLHGGWMHLFINVTTLAAFGTGVERFFGAKRMLIIFMASSLLAALTHLAFSPYSLNPIIGASGGISGLFGAVLILLQRQNQLAQTNQRILPIALAFIFISVIFGYIGAPDGSPIAWVAHIGGFIGGLLISKGMAKKA